MLLVMVICFGITICLGQFQDKALIYQMFHERFLTVMKFGYTVYTECQNVGSLSSVRGSQTPRLVPVMLCCAGETGYPSRETRSEERRVGKEC